MRPGDASARFYARARPDCLGLAPGPRQRKCCQPPGPWCGVPSTVTPGAPPADLADHPPAGGQRRARRERGDQGVILAAGQHPLDMRGGGRDAGGGGRDMGGGVTLRFVCRIGHRQRCRGFGSGRRVRAVSCRDRSATPLAAATWPRSASRPSLTSIIAVAPSSAASGPAAYGGRGAAGRRRARSLAAVGRRGAGDAGREQRQAGRRVAEGPPRRPRRLAGAGAEHRAAASQVAECGHRQDHGVAARRVAADDPGPCPAPPPPRARPPGRGPARGSVAGAASATSSAVFTAPSRRCPPGSARRPSPRRRTPWTTSRRKCLPSISRSTAATTLPDGVPTTAASSPMPTLVSGPAGMRARRAAMTPNSPRSATDPITSDLAASRTAHATVAQI